MIMQQFDNSEIEVPVCEDTFSDNSQKRSIPFSESLLMNTIMNNSQDTIYVKDIHLKFIMNSQAHARQFNLTDSREMIGKSDSDYFPEDFALRTRLEEQEIMRTGHPLIGSIEKVEIEPGKHRWFSASKYPLYDERGRIIGIWGTSRDITVLKQAEESLAQANEELRSLSRIDELSGLYNRRYFFEALYSCVKCHDDDLACGKANSFCLVSLDIDHFKAVNDTHGHTDGDEAIRHISRILQENCRATDLVFRIGGDEYSILLPNTGLSSARLQSERIRRAVESTPLALRGISCPLTVSIGVSCFDDFADVNELVRDADVRLYTSKRHGRNRVT